MKALCHVRQNLNVQKKKGDKGHRHGDRPRHHHKDHKPKKETTETPKRLRIRKEKCMGWWRETIDIVKKK